MPAAAPAAGQTGTRAATLTTAPSGPRRARCRPSAPGCSNPALPADPAASSPAPRLHGCTNAAPAAGTGGHGKSPAGPPPAARLHLGGCSASPALLPCHALPAASIAAPRSACLAGQSTADTTAAMSTCLGQPATGAAPSQQPLRHSATLYLGTFAKHNMQNSAVPAFTMAWDRNCRSTAPARACGGTGNPCGGTAATAPVCTAAGASCAVAPPVQDTACIARTHLCQAA